MIKTIKSNGLAHPRISIIIPTLDNPNQLLEVLTALQSQTLKPSEIIISDSSASEEINFLCSSYQSNVPIVYTRCGKAYPLDRMTLKVKSLMRKTTVDINKQGRAYPYESTNFGAMHAQYSWLAFLDATTVPNKSWLTECWEIIKSESVDMVLGSTQYKGKTRFQELLLASSFGKKPVESIPGTVIKKSCFSDIDQIIQGVRSGGDLEWRSRMKVKYKWSFPDRPLVEYSHLATNIFSAAKKVFIYQFYGALLDIQRNVKTTYLILTLLLLSLVIPRWNYIAGWDSAFFLPNITKIYLVALVVIFFLNIIIYRFLLNRLEDSPLLKMLRLMIILFSIYAIFSWNRNIAFWFVESSLYVPHITKIYISLLFAASILYRGLYFPKKNGISLAYLLPLRWIMVGCIGLILDIAKTPGYIIGSFMPLFLKKR